MTKDSARPTPVEPSGRDVVTRGNLDASLRDPKRKQAFVSPLFDMIAPRYDRFTRAFSYGMDARWKRELISWIASDFTSSADAERALAALDVACGTGDLAFLAAHALPMAQVTGVDLSEPMLTLARTRVDAATAERLRFALGDLARLDLPDESVDLVTAGYAIRNAPDPRQALGEIARVLRPGGRLYVLDFFRPTPRGWRVLYLAYLRAAGMAVGWWWHTAPATYEYIAASIARFVSCREFAGWLSAAGFRVARVAPKLGGGVALVSAERR